MEEQQLPASDMPPQPRRRTLLNRIWAVLTIIAFIELSWLGSVLLKSRRTRAAQQKGVRYVEAGRVESYQPGDVRAIPEGMLYLACLGDHRFIALSRTCTHLGCALGWDADQQKFVCPCHGSTFDQAGVVLTAPAIRPLDFYPVRIEDGNIRIEVSNVQRRSAFDFSQTTGI